LTSFGLLTGSGRVGSPGQKPSGRVESRVKNPDPIPSLGHGDDDDDDDDDDVIVAAAENVAGSSITSRRAA